MFIFTFNSEGPSWSWSYGSWIYNYMYLCNHCLSPLTLWGRTPLRRSVLDTTFTTLCDKGCQWLLASRWFSPGTPVSSTNKTDRHDITEILLKVTLNTIKKKNTFDFVNKGDWFHLNSRCRQSCIQCTTIICCWKVPFVPAMHLINQIRHSTCVNDNSLTTTT